uniref:ATP-binding cassette sub-family A member 2 n=1 Tax=Ascaris suum TaxID=6253 RepID=F1L1T5_ASCSU
MQQDDTLVTAYVVCGIVFMILPQYNLGMAMYRMNFVYMLYEQGTTYLEEISRPEEASSLPLPHPLEWHLMGRHCIALFLQFLFFAILLTIIEYQHALCKFLRNRERNQTKLLLERDASSDLLDVDVLREQQRVAILREEDGYDKYTLIVDSLAKSYNKKSLAVRGLSFIVDRGECFGLLGVNGAGKTTTFNMLTGRIEVGCGDAFICGRSVSQGGVSSLRQLGYCPQFDALNPKLTAREQLTFYARLRAIPEDRVDEVVGWALNEMQLRAYADETSRSYSGGNKRKLSAAIALIADPPIILLDEPSAGMDPSSQHFMWNLILQLRRANRTVIITSHSMEECEMLCTRIAIMVKGQLQCLGPLQHLKQKFGEGYTLTMKLTNRRSIARARTFMEENLPGAKLEAVHCCNMFYRISSSSCSVAQAFDAICKLREKVDIDDYSLSQTTLDEVFVSFAQRSLEGEIAANGSGSTSSMRSRTISETTSTSSSAPQDTSHPDFDKFSGELLAVPSGEQQNSTSNSTASSEFTSASAKVD